MLCKTNRLLARVSIPLPYFFDKTEKAEPGFYSVKLEDYNIDVELTAALRSGFHKYKFPKTDKTNIIIDLTNAVTSDVILALEIEIPGHDGMCVPPFNIWTKNRVYFLQTSESHNVAIIHSIPRNPSDEKTPLSVNG